MKPLGYKRGDQLPSKASAIYGWNDKLSRTREKQLADQRQRQAGEGPDDVGGSRTHPNPLR